MASLSSGVPMSARLMSRTERADDIARLKVELQLPALKYVDVSLQRELRHAVERWPLFAELEQAQHAPGTRVSLVRRDEPQVTA
ncbi:cellulose biosynthesis protein BcsR [Pseudomonas sp. SJZ085]|nr:MULTISPECIES: cellulose biosynthesis protein BcsR [unclassified Pseudomonas]TWC23471.1 cellulose biosynthesis protein BcsR [Pseudomonas sp. SJZ074]TWC40582.1 cellulose biosynthesis protein BcsR [Pseudomonas sp. SJZ085]